MSATTDYSPAFGTLADAPAASAPKGLWKRLFDRLIESRMRKADDLMRQYRHLIPRELEAQAVWQITERSEGSLPFIR